MNTIFCKRKFLPIAILTMILFSNTNAGEVKILAADFTRSANNQWAVSVTLKHHDTGWDHYADDWRVVDNKGNVLGNRVLYHPHVSEQPFTRSLSGVKIPPGLTQVYIEAHDKVHGWTPDRLAVDLRKADKGRLRVEAGQVTSQ